MKTPVSACFQISAYSERIAEQIAERIRQTIKDGDEPSNPIVEDWTGNNQIWPPDPLVYIFFSIVEEDELDSKGIPLKVINAIADENVDLWIESKKDPVLEAKRPESIGQHIDWVCVPFNGHRPTILEAFGTSNIQYQGL